MTAAGMLNALDIAGKKIEEANLICLGAGSAAISCVKLLVSCGMKAGKHSDAGQPWRYSH